MEMVADKESMFELGQKYQQAGLRLTPGDCKPVDDFIFLSSKGQPPLDRVKTYNELRGAFNRGWNAAHAGITE